MDRFLLLLQLSSACLVREWVWGRAGSGAARQVRLWESSERGLSASERVSWPRFILRAEGIWQLNLPKGERFDASGLALNSKGELLALSDRWTSHLPD